VVLSSSATSCHLLLNAGATVSAPLVAVNGTSASALCLNSAILSATTIAVQGGVLNNKGTLKGTLRTHQPPAADPLAGVPRPTAPAATCPGAACPDGATLNGGHTYRLLPGTYTTPIVVNVGAVACVAPGLFVLNASWTLDAPLRPYGSTGCPPAPAPPADPGVLLYFAQGSVVLNSGGDLSALVAPHTGRYAGLLYWQAGNAAVALNGTGGFGGGGWYAPAGSITLNGVTHVRAPFLIVASATVNGGTAITITSS
jgi:hypothetical protein